MDNSSRRREVIAALTSHMFDVSKWLLIYLEPEAYSGDPFAFLEVLEICPS